MAEHATAALAQIEARIHSTLEARLAQTLGQVKALQRITTEITATERDIRQHQAIAAQIEADLKGSQRKSLKAELEGEKTLVERLQVIRDGLVSDLSTLADALDS
jgi:hypothetical protein